MGAKGDWDFRISDLVKNPDGIDIKSVVNFGEVQRAQLAKSTLLTSTLVSVGSFRSIKVCLDAKEQCPPIRIGVTSGHGISLRAELRGRLRNSLLRGVGRQK